VRFELRNEEDNSDESIESNEEVEQRIAVVRRFERVRKPFERYSPPDFHFTFFLTATNVEPKLVKEVVDSTKGRLLKDTMVGEMGYFHKNDTWDLVELPNGRNPVGSKWVFKKKMNIVGQVEKFKAQLVAKGYCQVEGVDFGNIFSPIAKLNFITVLMSLAAIFDLEIE
jgi:hypothetical protein